MKNALTIAILAALALAGCRKDGEEPPADSAAPAEANAAPAAPVEPDPVKRRMRDPEYMKKINSLKAEMVARRREVIEARRALEEAKARNAPAEEIEALDKARIEREEALQANLMKSTATVSAQMRGDAAANGEGIEGNLKSKGEQE